MKYSIVLRLSVLLLAQMLVPVVFQNLPSPVSSFYFYLILWMAAAVLMKPKLIFQEMNGWIMFFAIFYFLMFISGLYSLGARTYNYSFIINRELLPIFISTTLFLYFVKYESVDSLILIVKAILIFLSITMITTSIGLTIVPDAARKIGGYLGSRGELELMKQYERMGIAGYDFYYGLAYVIPVFIFILYKHWKDRWPRIMIMIFILLILYTIIKAQMTTAVFFAVIFSFLAVIGCLSKTKASKNKIAIVLIILFPLILMPTTVYISGINALAHIVPGETLQGRLLDVGQALEYMDQDIEEDETHTARRAERLPYLWGQFKNSPIIGGGDSTGHNYWLDRLALFGIIGMIPWVFLLYNVFKAVKKRISDESTYYYILTYVAFISIGFLKNSGGKILYLLVVFLAPALLIIYSNNRTLFKDKKHSP